MVDVERVSEGDIIGVLLREPGVEDVERPAAVAGACDGEPPIDGDAFLVADPRDEPGHVGVVRVDGDGEAE
jgi:hypothetical protein